jgi:hypothetical protein
MPERPRPDLDHTREALRRHDARPDDPVEDAPEADERAADEGDGEEKEPGRGP